MTTPLHDMLPRTRHDERARQDFVTALREALAARIMPGNRIVYEREAAPAYRAAHGHPPRTHREVRRAMQGEPYYRFWSALQRRSQELMWESVIEPTERELDALIERFRERAADGGAPGSLRLDPALEIPAYHTAVDIHLQPGGYHTEVAEDDVAAGALYDGGLPIYIGGALGPDNDLLGRMLSAYAEETLSELEPRRILDMGCTVGASTLPWHAAYPAAELHAIDVAAPCLRYGFARARGYGVPVHFSQQNAEATDFEDESFDLVVSHIMLHETSRRALGNILGECRRLLAPGGVMLHLEIPRGAEPFEQFMYQWETYNNNEPFAAYLTDADLPAMAVSAGFAPEAVRMDAVRLDLDETQSNYAESAPDWPVLVGEKRAAAG